MGHHPPAQSHRPGAAAALSVGGGAAAAASDCDARLIATFHDPYAFASSVRGWCVVGEVSAWWWWWCVWEKGSGEGSSPLCRRGVRNIDHSAGRRGQDESVGRQVVNVMRLSMLLTCLH